MKNKSITKISVKLKENKKFISIIVAVLVVLGLGTVITHYSLESKNRDEYEKLDESAMNYGIDIHEWDGFFLTESDFADVDVAISEKEKEYTNKINKVYEMAKKNDIKMDMKQDKVLKMENLVLGYNEVLVDYYGTVNQNTIDSAEKVNDRFIKQKKNKDVNDDSEKFKNAKTAVSSVSTKLKNWYTIDTEELAEISKGKLEDYKKIVEISRKANIDNSKKLSNTYENDMKFVFELSGRQYYTNNLDYFTKKTGLTDVELMETLAFVNMLGYDQIESIDKAIKTANTKLKTLEKETSTATKKRKEKEQAKKEAEAKAAEEARIAAEQEVAASSYSYSSSNSNSGYTNSYNSGSGYSSSSGSNSSGSSSSSGSANSGGSSSDNGSSSSSGGSSSNSGSSSSSGGYTEPTGTCASASSVGSALSSMGTPQRATQDSGGLHQASSGGGTVPYGYSASATATGLLSAAIFNWGYTNLNMTDTGSGCYYTIYWIGEGYR